MALFLNKVQCNSKQSMTTDDVGTVNHGRK